MEVYPDMLTRKRRKENPIFPCLGPSYSIITPKGKKLFRKEMMMSLNGARKARKYSASRWEIARVTQDRERRGIRHAKNETKSR
jgi:hypothetical protein